MWQQVRISGKGTLDKKYIHSSYISCKQIEYQDSLHTASVKATVRFAFWFEVFTLEPLPHYKTFHMLNVTSSGVIHSVKFPLKCEPNSLFTGDSISKYHFIIIFQHM